jgi:hypothetical protein
VKKVFTGEHPMLAHVVCGLLEEHGIRARVAGEEVFGIRGEVGFDFESAPAVWVADEDAERAVAILREHQERLRVDVEPGDEPGDAPAPGPEEPRGDA